MDAQRNVRTVTKYLGELLPDIPEAELTIGGRDFERAHAFCATYHEVTQVKPLQLDRIDIDRVLAAEKPDTVVDASRPFQEYGDGCYRLIQSCIAAKINYLDFADAAEFVLAPPNLMMTQKQQVSLSYRELIAFLT